MRTAAAASPGEFGDEFTKLYARCAPMTMTTVERMFALYSAVNYLHGARIPGAIVECGVWRGGSSMLAGLTLIERSAVQRGLWLFDTFAGMPEPGPEDASWTHEAWRGHKQSDGWVRSPLESVRQNMLSTGLAADQFTLVEGLVEDTVPRCAPAAIGLLRLDTDFYESTLHELVHLWPRLSVGGVLIIDDYGSFVGARKAVDQFFADRQDSPLLVRIDRDSRIAVKTRL